jgi:hypothetical protein
LKPEWRVRSHANGYGRQHFEQQTDVTSTLPPGPKHIGPAHEFRFDRHMVNFLKKAVLRTLR